MIDFSTGGRQRKKDALERWNLSGCITLSIFLKLTCQLEIEKG